MIPEKNKDWLQDEIEEINKEINNNYKLKNEDTKKMLKFLMILIPLIGYALLANAGIDCPHCGNQIKIDVKMETGHAWRCKKCLKYIYQEIYDWQGYYYCPNCGTREGDE